MAYKFLNSLTVINSTFSSYNSGGTANDSLKLSSSNLGASFGVQNTNASGYAGIEYIDNSGNVKVFTGFNNGNGQEFRFNNVASGGYIDFLIGGTTGLKLFNNRNVTIGSATDSGYKLDVNGTGRVQGQLEVLSTSSAQGLLLKHTALSTTATQIYYNSSDAVTYLDTLFSYTASQPFGSVNIRTKDSLNALTSRLYVEGNSGNVGIGTSSPSYKLDVNGTGRVQTSITIGGAADGTLFFPNTTSGHQMRIYTQYASNAMVIFANGYNLNLSGGGGMTSNFCTTITGSNGSAALTVQQGNVAWSPVLVVNAIGSTGTRFNTNGNVLIGTTTDAGQKLQLAGNQAITIAGIGDGFNLTRTGAYDNTTLTTLATITDTTSNANRAKTGLYVNVTNASTNIAIQTVGAVGVGVTPPSNSFASGYFSYLYAGATVNSAANYNLNVRSTISSFAAGNGGGMSFWGDDRGQAGANTAFAGIRGVKENGTYLNGLGALTFLTQASSAGLSTESTFAEVGRFTSGGNFLIGTTTNAGYKLDVNGTARIVGVATFNNNINQTSGTATFANGILLDSTRRIFGGNTITYQSNDAASQHYFKNDISSGLSGTLVTIGNGSGAFGTTSASNFLNISGRLATASGTNNLTSILLNHTVENTGTYTGTIRGIYYNPSSIIGTGFTHRAIETTTGDVLFGTTSGVVGIGTTTLSTEANLYLGAKSTIEGGQLVLQKGTSQTYATHLDNYNNQFRVMVGTDTGSTAAQLIVMHATGNVLINSGTDNGYKFQVAGNVNVNTGSNTNNLVVNADTTMFYNLTSGGGQVQSNVYTTSVTTKYTANGSSSVALFEWDPTLCQGVFVDYVVLVDGINRLRSGTLVIVNDNGGNVTITDNINSSVNGSSSAVTFTTAGMASIRLYCNNGYAASDVFVNIVTRYIPNIY